MSLKDLASKTAGVAARQVERAAEREPKTAPVRLYDVTQRLHAAEGEVEALQAKLAAEQAAHAASLAAGGGSVEKMVPVALMDDSPFQSRLVINQTKVEDIGQSMRTAGQRSPVTLRRKPDGRYELIKGHTRKYGAINEGIEELRALIVERTDSEARLDLWLDNTGDENTEFEFALMYRAAVDEGYVRTQEEIGGLFGHSQGAVSKRLKMLKLPDDVQQRLQKKPALFGTDTSAIIVDLWENHPAHTALILQFLDRMADDDTVKQNGLKPWVLQQIALAEKKAKSKSGASSERRHFPFATGDAAYVTFPKGRDLVLRLVDSELDMDATRKAIEETLERLAKEAKVAKGN